MVITTGGTGITGRDVTPEAFDRVLEKRIEGFGELFRMLSYQKIGTSTMQSRALGGVAGGTYLFALARQHRRGEGRVGRHTGVPARQPVSPLQPGGADAAAAGASQDGSGVAARATIASRSLAHCGAAGACGLDDVGGRRLGGSRIERRCRRVFDLQLNCLRDLWAGEFRHHGQREIDAGGDTTAGEQVAIAHHAAIGGRRAECGEQIAGAPVRCCSLAAQQTGGAQYQRAGADRADVARARGLLAQPVEDFGILHQRIDAWAAGHTDDVERRAVAQRGVGQQTQAGIRLDRFQRLRQQQHLGIGHPREHLERAGEVELRHAREQQQSNP